MIKTFNIITIFICFVNPSGFTQQSYYTLLSKINNVNILSNNLFFEKYILFMKY